MGVRLPARCCSRKRKMQEPTDYGFRLRYFCFMNGFCSTYVVAVMIISACIAITFIVALGGWASTTECGIAEVGFFRGTESCSYAEQA